MPATDAQKLLYGSRLTEDVISNRVVRGYNATATERPALIEAGAQVIPSQTETAQFIANKAGLPNTEATSAVLASFGPHQCASLASPPARNAQTPIWGERWHCSY